MKIRTNKELLQVMLNNISIMKNEYTIDGLCILVNYLYNVNLINYKEKQKLLNYLKKYLPEKIKSGTNQDYCWKPGLIKPRIKWLEEQIQKLTKTGANKNE